jgi:hypothetical protein
MEWYRLNISYNEAVSNAKDEMFISLLKNYHSLSVSLGSVVLYRTPLDNEQGTSFFLHCNDEMVLNKLMKDFDLQRSQSPNMDELVPVYGEFLGMDVAEVFGMEETGERAPSSAAPFAEPYRDGDAGYGMKQRMREESRPAQQRERGSSSQG